MKFIVVGQAISVADSSFIVSGTTGKYIAEFNFDSSWNNLTPTAVFRCGSDGTVYEMSITDGVCDVPAEVIENRGLLYVGVYGVNGSVQYPTIWAEEQTIWQGVTDGETPSTPTPSIYAQIIAQLATKLSDAPSDGKTYGRKGGAWKEVTGGGGGMDIHGQTTEDSVDDADEFAFYDSSAEENRKTSWSNIKSKLNEYFDALYTWALIKPASGIPKSDLISSVQSSLDKADTALQEHQSLSGYATETWVEGKGYLTQHQSLSAYRTSADQDLIDSTKQKTIVISSTQPENPSVGDLWIDTN